MKILQLPIFHLINNQCSIVIIIIHNEKKYQLWTVYIVYSFILISVHFRIGTPVNWFVMMSIENSNKKILMFIFTIMRAWIE